MGGAVSVEKLSEEEERNVLDFNVSVKSIADKIKQCEINNEAGVIIMAGAGISVSAGIPDFRSPDTGLYANLEKYDLPTPQSIFNIEYFREKPQAFYTLAKEMWPGNFNPTITHFFMKLLENKGVLKRCFTQNIDTLEREVGLDLENLVEAHGSFGEAHCIECNEEHSHDWIKKEIINDQIPTCTKCKVGYVKPDIVFFGENLSSRFAEKRKEDLPDAKVLLVMGTSLTVTPFCNLIHEVNARTPRLLLNLTPAASRRLNGSKEGFRFDEVSNYRDAALLQDCDSGVRLLCQYLGWEDELTDVISSFYKQKGLEVPTMIISSKYNTQNTTKDSTTPKKTTTSTTPKKITPSPNPKNKRVSTTPSKKNNKSTSPLTTTPQKMDAQTISTSDMKLLTYNWRCESKPLPDLQPFSSSSSGIQNQIKTKLSNNSNNNNNNGHMNMTCQLIEPVSIKEIKQGEPIWLKIGFETDKILEDRFYFSGEFIGLYPHHPIQSKTSSTSKEAAMIASSNSSSSSQQLNIHQKLNRGDYPFDYTSAARRELNDHIDACEDPETGLNVYDMKSDLKLTPKHEVFKPPFIERALKLEIPKASTSSSSSTTTTSTSTNVNNASSKTSSFCQYEIWYANEITSDVLARWGPITVRS